MPFINVRISSPDLTPEQTLRIQHNVTTLMSEILGKKAELTSVLVEQVVDGSWSIGGKPTELAAHLDATITAGTNTVAEKAHFIEEAHRMLKTLFGPKLPIATYVVIDEISADAWGYDGQTQAYRAALLESQA